MRGPASISGLNKLFHQHDTVHKRLSDNWQRSVVSFQQGRSRGNEATADWQLCDETLWRSSTSHTHHTHSHCRRPHGTFFFFLSCGCLLIICQTKCVCVCVCRCFPVFYLMRTICELDLHSEDSLSEWGHFVKRAVLRVWTWFKGSSWNQIQVKGYILMFRGWWVDHFSKVCSLYGDHTPIWGQKQIPKREIMPWFLFKLRLFHFVLIYFDPDFKIKCNH